VKVFNNTSSETNSRFASKIPRLFGARRFIIIFIKANSWSLFDAKWIKSPSYSISFRSILILSSNPRLRLPVGLCNYTVNHLKGNPTTIMYCDTRIKSEAHPPPCYTLPTTYVKVTLLARSLLTPAAQILFYFWILLCMEIVFCSSWSIQ
jgi:hypothetical protein